MRGEDRRSGHLFSYVDLESRVGADHPLRAIRPDVNAALAATSGDFAGIYSRVGRPSIARSAVAGASAAILLLGALGAAEPLEDGSLEIEFEYRHGDEIVGRGFFPRVPTGLSWRR